MPYECILFDGAWGIGKTYAIDDVLLEQENVCRISMFGLQNGQQIYHEVLFQSVLKNKKAGRVGELASDVLTGMASIWEGAAQAKDVWQSIAREKEIFLLMSNRFSSLHIIVLDDLERISEVVSMEEVLGIVEELKKCNYVKVILVANTEELKGNNKSIFEKYQEKVIDRVYHITERPNNVNWGELRIHAGFVQDFLTIHKVKNLRTLQKAQKFYDDVKLYCCGTCAITNEDMKIEYEIFLQAGKKPNFYKNDAELKQMLPGLFSKMKDAGSLSELNKFADECAFWSDILEEDSSLTLEKYKGKLHAMLWNIVMEGHEEVLSYSYDMWHTSSEKVKQVYEEERDSIRSLMIKEYVEYLSKTTKGEKAFEYSYKLREYFGNTYYRDIIKEMAVDLYNRKSFPVDDIDVKQYDTCYNIMYVLYHTDEEKFLAYCEELSKECDRMSAYRLDLRMQDIIKGY